MAEEHNAIKYGTTISRAASTALGGGYGDVGVSRLSETLTPVADLWKPPEWALLRGEILFARTFVSGAVALRNSAAELINPVGSQKIAVVTHWRVRAGAPEIVTDSGGSIVANPVTMRGVARDTRYPQRGEVSIFTIVAGDLAAAAVNEQWETSIGVLDWGIDFIIRPGSKLFFVNATQNQAFQLSVAWRERSPFPGELQATG